MFCGECGTENPDTNIFCKDCGKPLKKPGSHGVSQAEVVQAPAAPYVQPVKGIVTPQAQPTQVPAQGSVGAPKKSRKALYSSIILGVASCLILPYIFGALAVILGIWAVYKKDTLGVIGIVIGALVMVVNYFYLVFFP
jgi:hypothetical protein